MEESFEVHKFGEGYLPIGTLCKLTNLIAPHGHLSGREVVIQAGPMMKRFADNTVRKAYMTDLFINNIQQWVTRDVVTVLEWPNYVQAACDKFVAYVTRPLSQCNADILDGLYYE